MLLALIGLPIILEGLTNTAAYKIELGEYVHIPGLVAVLISGLLFTLPLAGGLVWSLRRMRAID